MEPPLPEMRVGDKERREVDSLLQAAHGDGVLTLTEYDERAAKCWAARTRSELDVLVRDLPNATGVLGAEQPTTAVAKPARSVTPLRHRIRAGLLVIAVIAGVGFAGTRVIGASDGATIFGSRPVTVAPGDDRVEVGTLFGNTTVIIPPDTYARTVSVMVFGGVDCDLACTPAAGQREVVVDAKGMFGSVDVMRQGEPRPQGDDDRDRDRDSDDD
ncbi:DUF1707 domain-containing protein [Actinomycetes bacterium KLBMP 9759]